MPLDLGPSARLDTRTQPRSIGRLPMLKLLFWMFVAVDVVAVVVFGLLGLAAAGPSRTNPLAALVIPFFIPAALLALAVLLFLKSPGTAGRVAAVVIAALPVLLVLGSKAAIFWELRPFRDASGSLRQFRSQGLREVEDAITRGDAAAVTAAARGVDLNTPGLSGATVLVQALRQLQRDPGQLAVVKALLAAGADPNGGKVEPPLQPAIGASRSCGLEPVRLLLEAGADPNARTEEGQPVFFIAGGADIGVEVLELLLARGADLNFTDSQGRSALVVPLMTRNWRVLKLLLQRGVPWRDQKGLGGVPLVE
ncbi:MAG: hypothetical protein J0L84_19685, partial [Verrucomicrobia bacterium]|nr:hypothetical protein [Verrucomicrobiota bacterium]